MNFKNKSSEMAKEKFPPIIFNEEHGLGHSTLELPPIEIKQREEEKVMVEKSNTCHEPRKKIQREYLSLHQKKEEPKSVIGQKPGRTTKQRAPGRTILLKNQSKLFH